MMLKIMKEPRTWSQAPQPPSGAASCRVWLWTTAALVSCLAAGDEDGSWLSFSLEVDCIVVEFIDEVQK